MNVDWSSPTPCSEAAQLRARAETYRQMAATARAVGSGEALLRLAARYDALAVQQEIAMESNPA